MDEIYGATTLRLGGETVKRQVMVWFPPFAQRTPELVAARTTIAKLKAKLEARQ